MMGKTRTNLIRRVNDDGEEEELDEIVEDMRVAAVMSGQMQIIRKEADIEDAIDVMYAAVDTEIDKYTENGSGFKWIRSASVEVSTSRFVGMMGKNSQSTSIEFQTLVGSYIPLPKWLRTRRVINPKAAANDERCFIWALLRGLFPSPAAKIKKHITDLRDKVDRISLPPNTAFPVPCTNRFFRSVEEMNDFSFSVFLLGDKEYEVHPLYVTKRKKEKHIILGVIEQNEGRHKQHFVLINDLSSIVAPTVNRKRFFCENCFYPSRSAASLKAHEEECLSNNPTRVSCPTWGGKDHKLIFNQWRYKLPALFTCYADLEALLKPPSETNNNPQVFANHKPVAWAYWIKCWYPQHELTLGANGKPLSEIRSYCGQGSIHKLFESLAEDAEACETIVKDLEFKKYTGPIPHEYDVATVCHICGSKGFSLTDANYKKVLDHDHMTGEYRGAAHSQCNLQFYSTKHWRLPIFFHNLKGYDGYHIIKGLKGYSESIEKMTCIARNLDKFTSFTIDNLRFVDSLQFLIGSLDANVEAVKTGRNLQQLKEAFKPVVDGFKLDDDDDRFNLLMGKGVYPYEYMKNKEVMNETELPPIEAFYSALKGEGITQEDYERAKECWEAFGCQTLADYTLLYVKLDVLQLASAFEIFRATCLAPNSVELDPSHFITAPSLSWHAMLLRNRRNKVEIENMTDLTMMMMVEKGVRGGMCMVMNPYLTTDDKHHGFYWDANNLYGWTMCNCLPFGGYRWEKLRQEIDIAEDLSVETDQQETLTVDTSEKDLPEGPNWLELAINEDYKLWHQEDMAIVMSGILELDPEGERGYILEVDTEYPKELHDLHNEMPFFPEKKSCQPSDYTVAQIKKVNPKYNEDRPSTTKKLVLDFEPRHKYVVHYRMLQEAIRHGVKITKVHRVFSFKQSKWLKDFIDFCTANRAKCTEETGKNTWKLFANSIYGKTVEDVRIRKDVEVICGPDARERALRVASSPHIKQWRVVIDDELLLVEKNKHKTILNRPVVIGFCVLEISKLHMYDWHYNHIKSKFGDKAELHYMDTDSTVYRIQSDNINEELYQLQLEKECFDLSKIKDKQHPLLQDLGQGKPPLCGNVLGKFKDEMLGVRLLSAVFLRPKSYSVMVDGGKALSKMKGVPKSARLPCGRKINHQDYEDVFRGIVLPTVKFHGFAHTKQMQLQTRQMKKVGLTNTDDKSFYFNAWESLRYGHFRIKEYMES